MFFKKEKNQCSEPTRKGPQKKRVKTAEKDFKKRAKKRRYFKRYSKESQYSYKHFNL